MKRLFVLTLTLLLFFVLTASAANFLISDYTDQELLDIRRQIHEHFSKAKRGDLLYEDQNVSFSYLGWKISYGSFEFWISFVNKTDKNLMITSENTSVNDAACYARSLFTIPAGKRTNAAIISVSESTMKEQWIDQIEHVEFAVQYYDNDNWSGLNIITPTPFSIDFVEPVS